MKLLGGAPHFYMTDILLGRGKLDTDTHRKKTLWKHMEKMAIYKSREGFLEETTTNILILNFSLQNSQTVTSII